ncbi:DNA-directed primase/polymerase protein-like [Octopus sinensis]|uniref:DNA-directed primase/polymerase protein n=1 Tax=Octopus sinensis TaxID=2607531 RepID=A0A6P7TH55_9MOLL|nr:DNA-directed primase/polymerase protein-like [Octopus sinensis]
MDPEVKSQFFPAVNFYGTSRKRKRIEKKLDQKAAKYSEEIIPKKFPTRIIGPSPTWKPFFKQSEAFSYVRAFPQKDLHVFAYESKSFVSEVQGQRMFLASPYPVFWHYYSQLKESKRHHYEIIPEGAVCKLYFDVEFYRENNPTLDGHRVCDRFIEYVCAWIRHLFKVPCDCRCVLRLDASTSSKYSEHLIFILNQAAFKDNSHVGSFVQFICSHLVTWLRQNRADSEQSKPLLQEEPTVVDPSKTPSATPATMKDSSCSRQQHLSPQLPASTSSPTRNMNSSSSVVINGRDILCEPGKVLSQFSPSDLKETVVFDKDGDETAICDLGVYSKNRNFRLFLSSKLGKKNPFLVSDHNQYPTDQSDQQSFFYDSLIANVQYHQDLRILTFSTPDEIKLKQKRLLAVQKNEDNLKGDYSSNPSPYPEIDAFINSIISSEGRKGRVFRWMYFSNENLLGYDICQYRWCGNIGREHRSNNIRLIVDLKQCVYYQKCHDPDCKRINYRSEDYLLPDNLLPWLNDTTLDEDFEDSLLVDALESQEKIDDSLLVEAVEVMEGKQEVTDLSMDADDDEEDRRLLVAAEEMEKDYGALPHMV